MGETRVVLGPPGTGKTTYLSKQIARAVEARGVDAVMVSSFTRAAAKELAGRVDLPKSQLGTMHALCYRQLGYPEIADVGPGIKQWNESAPEAYKLNAPRGPVEQRLDGPDSQFGASESGHGLKQSYEELRNRMVPRGSWPSSVLAFAREWESFKTDTGLLDFTDMIERVIEDGTPLPSGVTTGFFDEVQDFTPLEMRLVAGWSEKLQTTILVGDEDQTIYGFKGANPRALTERVVSDEFLTTLKQSYRVPRAVHAVARSIVTKIVGRYDAEYKPTPLEGEAMMTPKGSAYNNPHIISELFDSEPGTLMILGTTHRFLFETRTELLRLGIPFHNPYRVDARSWNPLDASTGTPMAVKIHHFLAPAERGQLWTRQQLGHWLPLLESKRALRHGAKSRVERWDTEPHRKDEIVSLDELLELFNEDDLASALVGDVDWFHSVAAYRSKTDVFDGLAAIAKRGGAKALVATPRVIIGTVHSVKGGEADTVLVYPDLSKAAMRRFMGSQDGRDEIHRLFYVAVTRARRRVVLGQAAKSHRYQWPIQS